MPRPSAQQIRYEGTRLFAFLFLLAACAPLPKNEPTESLLLYEQISPESSTSSLYNYCQPVSIRPVDSVNFTNAMDIQMQIIQQRVQINVINISANFTSFKFFISQFANPVKGQQLVNVGLSRNNYNLTGPRGYFLQNDFSATNTGNILALFDESTHKILDPKALSGVWKLYQIIPGSEKNLQNSILMGTFDSTEVQAACIPPENKDLPYTPEEVF